MPAQKVVDVAIVGVNTTVRVIRVGIDLAAGGDGRLDLCPDQFETGQDIGRGPVRTLTGPLCQSSPPSEASLGVSGV